MRLPKPRIDPLPESEWSDEVRELLPKSPDGKLRPLNIFTTLARYPKLLNRWQVFGNHVLAKSTLPARERELVILRTGHLCKSGYEFHQHTRIGLAAGLTSDEIAKLQRAASEWTGKDAALIRATDELHADQFISEVTWKELAQSWNQQQLMDLVFAIGQYTLVSMALNSFGVQIEEGSK
ncbi:MAG TPA: carboxymuconolactone decarboxylase family protein [Polyangiales bacterium]|nr:carboxymuconolactone decarboxylase family protein [Polyangiales bacterium]